MSQRPSRRELRQLQDSQGLQQQQQNPNADTNALLQQLALIYGLQQEQQMAPEKMKALQLENQQRTYQNTQAPQEDAVKMRLGNAQAGHLEQESSGTLSPHDLAALAVGYGNQPLPGYLNSSMPQAYQAEQQQKAQAAEQQAQQQRDAFMATAGPHQQTQGESNPASTIGLGLHHFGQILLSLPQFLQAIPQGMASAGGDFARGLAGQTPPPPPNPYPYPSHLVPQLGQR